MQLKRKFFKFFLSLVVVVVLLVTLFALPALNSQGYADTFPNWTNTGSMNTARYRFATAVLQDGRVLAAGGTLDARADVYNPTTGLWTRTGPMSTMRRDPMAITLANGKILVAGGTDDNSVHSFSSAELYDPTTNAWTLTGPMNTPRWIATATLLPNGKVLAAGGISDSGYTSAAELYDPTTGTWAVTENMNETRGDHTATLLSDGKVLVSGGAPNVGPLLASSELYDPATGTWVATGSMNEARNNHTATLLSNGNVLVAGGVGPTATLVSTEIYNPATGIWTATGNLNEARVNHTANLLADGSVLVAGGEAGFASNAIFSSVELYNQITGTWTTTASMNSNRTQHEAVLLANGEVLAVGGNGPEIFASAELYKTVAPTPTPTAIPTPTNTPTPTPTPHNAPTTTASLSPSALSNGEYPNPVQVTLSATAATGFSVANTYYQIDSQSQQTYSAPFSVSSAGQHTVSFWSVDNTNLGETPHNSRTFTISSTVNDAVVTPGQNSATIGNTTITFSNITSPGYVYITPSSNNSGGPIPSTYKVLNTFYNITTTATFTGPVTISVNYDGQNTHQNLKLLHYDGSSWQDITQSSTLTNPATNTYKLTGNSPSLSPFAIVELIQSTKLTALNPAKVWVGLPDFFSAGAKFDLLAEAYKDATKVSSGQLNNVDPGLGFGGFSSAKLDTIPFTAFSPVDFPIGSKLSIKVYARTACTGSLSPLGTARLYYNDSQANSQFGATIGTTAKTYYLLNNLVLGTTVGAGPKKTADVQGGAACSAFKSFGTWTVTP